MLYLFIKVEYKSSISAGSGIIIFPESGSDCIVVGFTTTSAIGAYHY
jgi:hypothetical protein